MGDVLEFNDATQEIRGTMLSGRLKLHGQGVIFKNSKTGKVDQLQLSELIRISWFRCANGFGLRFMLSSGQVHRFGGFKEADQEKLSQFINNNFKMDLEEMSSSVKGWNWGTAKFQGSVLGFEVARQTCFEIPLSNVSHCTTAKNEVTLEFYQNDDAAVSLMELRFHIPSDNTDNDPVKAFHENVLSKANIIQATGESIATFKEAQCLTPRGRYDIKLFSSFIQLHGKTFDYKIPLTTVLRLFLLPHKDQRQMFFVVSLDPPIKQGQTRYHFLILQFNKEEEVLVEVGLSEKDIQDRYEGKLAKEMSGPTYEMVSRIMKALVQRKITVPGSFIGHSGTSAISCSYKAAAGFMYPLERGFIYVHKPPVHIRFDEVSCVNFARSGGSTRSFDFEIETKAGTTHTFSSIEKEEYSNLFDFVTNKKLRVKNRGEKLSTNKSKKKDTTTYDDELVDSDMEDENDPYLNRVKNEAREREEDGGSSESDESDVSFNPDDSGSDVAEEYDSNAPDSSSDSDAESGSGSDDDKKKRHKKEKKEKKPKKAKTVSETRKRRKNKEKRDPNQPKRPLSSYFLWLNANRDRIKKDNPGISITELTKKAAEMWKEIKDKTKWEEQAKEAKEKYEVAMAEYKKNLKESGISPPKKTSKKKESTKKESPKKKSSVSAISKEYISSSDSDSDSGKDKKKKATKKKSKSSDSGSSDSDSDDDQKKKPKKKDTSSDSDSDNKKGKKRAKSSDSDSDKGKKKVKPEPSDSDSDKGKNKVKPQPSGGDSDKGKKKVKPEPSDSDSDKGKKKVTPESSDSDSDKGKKKVKPESSDSDSDKGKKKVKPEPSDSDSDKGKKKVKPESSDSDSDKGKKKVKPEPSDSDSDKGKKKVKPQPSGSDSDKGKKKVKPEPSGGDSDKGKKQKVKPEPSDSDSDKGKKKKKNEPSVSDKGKKKKIAVKTEPSDDGSDKDKKKKTKDKPKDDSGSEKEEPSAISSPSSNVASKEGSGSDSD